MDPIIKTDIQYVAGADLPWGEIDNTTVLISGANGFLPSYLVFSLLERNHIMGIHTRVIAMCRNRERAETRFGDYRNDPDLELMIQDVTEPVHVDGPVDFCIHAASPAGIFSRQEHPVNTFETNVLGCRNLLELCRKKGCRRFLLLSSVDVYGKMYSDQRLREEESGYLDTMYPRNAYSNGKRAAEALCAAYHADFGVEAVVARPFQVFGPGMALEDGRLHGDFIGQLLRQRKIVLKSNGQARRSFLYLTDSTIALLLLLLRGTAGEAYNVCDEAGEASVSELAGLYRETAGEWAAVEFDYGQREKVEVKEALPCVLGCSGKLRELGWKPSVSLEEGIKRTWNYYKNYRHPV